MHLSPQGPPFSRAVLRHVAHEADQRAADLAVLDARKRPDQGEMEGLRQQGMRRGGIRPVRALDAVVLPRIDLAQPAHVQSTIFNRWPVNASARRLL